MRIIKGRLWKLSIHSISYWKEELRNPKYPPSIPYFTWKYTLPYEPFKSGRHTYTAMGIYIFPFVLRYFRKEKTSVHEKRPAQ